jgi:hypothetical protein
MVYSGFAAMVSTTVSAPSAIRLHIGHGAAEAAGLRRVQVREPGRDARPAGRHVLGMAVLQDILYRRTEAGIVAPAVAVVGAAVVPPLLVDVADGVEREAFQCQLSTSQGAGGVR